MLFTEVYLITMTITQLPIHPLGKIRDTTHYKPTTKSRLTPSMKKKRHIYATQYQNLAVQQCSKVLFSDVSSVQQFPISIRRPSTKRYDDRYTIPTVKYPLS